MQSGNVREVARLGSLVALMCGAFAGAVQAQDISGAAQGQIAAILAAKGGFSGAQKKVDSNLVFAAMASRNDAAVSSFIGIIPTAARDRAGNVVVDIRAIVTPNLLAAVTAAGGTVLNQSARWGMIHASLPLGAIETVAAHVAVRSIRTAPKAQLNGVPVFRKTPRVRVTPASIGARSGLDFVGALTSQGYITESANLVVVNQGINGAGVKVGVLSDSASASRIAALIATGDLPPGTVSLPGQDGPTIAQGGTDEGAAMMEIVHDMAPGASLIFATAFTDEISFADNIVALQAAGCKVIVDDVSYFDEGAFQDGPVAQAVNQVTAAGAIYFSSSANSGNLTFGTSGTWEGDFLSGGPVAGVIAAGGETGNVHNFGTAASPQNYDVLTAATPFVQLKWSDRLGGSTNDYDLFVLNSTGTAVLAFSTSAQDGSQDPYELVFLNNGNTNFPVNARVVVVQFSGVARALRVDTMGGTLSIKTSGATYGHNAGLNTVSTAATYWNSAKTGTRAFTGPPNPTEVFSSDGPRKIFYNPDGTAITPGNFLFATNGGTTLQKPDLSATDGVSAKTPGFNPFFGTSAASPHAAGVAALILQAKPGYTPAQVRTSMVNGTVDNMAAGVDRDSGYGIVMSTLAVQYALSH
jgi:hypothetical protein